MNLTEELLALLRRQGADLAAAADMRGAEGCDYPRAAAMAVALPKSLVRDLQKAPTEEYFRLYHSLNQKLNEIVTAGEEFLKAAGWRAWAQTTDRAPIGPDNRTTLPHKTAAARAGLGWIGKNCLLVTPEYGCAVRLSSLLTDAPLECAQPIAQSRCGDCQLCVQACPGRALKGTLWQAGMARERIVDAELCRKTQTEIMKASTGIETDLCGKCFALCAYTQRYLNRG